jgi:hypothetical protein
MRTTERPSPGCPEYPHHPAGNHSSGFLRPVLGGGAVFAGDSTRGIHCRLRGVIELDHSPDEIRTQSGNDELTDHSCFLMAPETADEFVPPRLDRCGESQRRCCTGLDRARIVPECRNRKRMELGANVGDRQRNGLTG